LRFLQRDAVLHQVGWCFAPIPGKLDIARSIILAISTLEAIPNQAAQKRSCGPEGPTPQEDQSVGT
jgi:hypothetical protein